MNVSPTLNSDFEPSPTLADWTRALIDGEATSEQHAALGALLAADTAARKWFVGYLQLHASLTWDASDLEEVLLEDAAVDHPSETNGFPLPGLDSLPSSLSAYSFAGWPVAYLIATVVFIVGLTIGALVHVSQPGKVVRVPGSGETPNPQSPIPDPSAVVARVAGMVDCVWEDSGLRVQGSEAANQKSEIRNHQSLIRLGDRLALHSGLLELTYDTGARVILQGPVTYEVESPTGGYLSVGKLTARLEKRSEVRSQRADSVNQESEIRNQKSPGLCPLASDLFAIRTPTATITDLGTEFGVVVDRKQAASVVVFQGQVDVESYGLHGAENHVRRLAVGQAVRIEPSGKMQSDIGSIADQFDELRAMPKAGPIALSPILFHDTFRNTANPEEYSFAGDYGLNRERFGRQTGRMAPAWYVRGGAFSEGPFNAQVHHPMHPDGLCLFLQHKQSGWLVLDRKFPADIELSAIVDPVAFRQINQPEPVMGDITSKNWVALSVRGSSIEPDSAGLPNASNAGAVFLIRSNGGWNYFENGIQIAAQVGTGAGVDRYAVRMRVVGDRLDVFVNGKALDLDPNRPATTRVLQGKAADSSNAFIGVGAHNFDGPPEPIGRQVSVVYDLQVTGIGSSDRALQSAKAK